MNTRGTRKGDRDIVRLDLTKNRKHSLVEAATFFNVGYNSMYRWIKAGHIKTSRDAENRYLISTAEIRRIMKEWAEK